MSYIYIMIISTPLYVRVMTHVLHIYIMIISTPLYVGVMTHVLYIYHDYFYPTLCWSNDPCLTYIS